VKRRAFITLLGGAAATWPLGSTAQERVRRVGVLNYLAADDPDSPPRVAAFAEALQGLGWLNGRNIQIDYRWGGGDLDLSRRYATELVTLVPDVILVRSGSALVIE
jgi:putative ABC transport system substrate-binding protein